jgi:hypothetical protein
MCRRPYNIGTRCATPAPAGAGSTPTHELHQQARLGRNRCAGLGVPSGRDGSALRLRTTRCVRTSGDLVVIPRCPHRHLAPRLRPPAGSASRQRRLRRSGQTVLPGRHVDNDRARSLDHPARPRQLQHRSPPKQPGAAAACAQRARRSSSQGARHNQWHLRGGNAVRSTQRDRSRRPAARVADEAAGQGEEGFVDLGAAFAADA